MSRIVVVGRQAPAPSALQACAEALTGAACTRLPARQWYQRIDAVHELTDGRLVATERDCHPDSIAEAFRRRITVLELQKIIGCGRGLWRTADNPLHVLVLTDVALDMPVEELTTDAAERPSFEDRQIAVGAIAFECAAHGGRGRNMSSATGNRYLVGRMGGVRVLVLVLVLVNNRREGHADASSVGGLLRSSRRM